MDDIETESTGTIGSIVRACDTDVSLPYQCQTIVSGNCIVCNDIINIIYKSENFQ